MNIPKIILVLLILLGAFHLRLHNYAVYPQRGATSDEYTYSFLGVSLLTKGVPISWSHFDYPNKTLVTMHNIQFPIVYPYFDHPPLYGLLVGGWSLLFGQDTFEKIDLKTIRIVPIILSTISSLFVFLIGQRLYSFKVGVWALLIYSTTTFFIMNSRVVVAENLLTTLLLASIYVFTSSKKMSAQKIVLLGVLSGLSIWTKALGIVVYITNVLFLLIAKYKWRMVAVLSSIFLLSVIGFIGYGFYFDKDLFWEVQGSQAGRNVGPGTLWTYTLQALVVNKSYINGWYFFGLFSLFFLSADLKKHTIIIFPAFAYFFLLLFSLTQFGHSGWYMIPLYPFMSLAMAYVVSESIKKMSWILLLFIIYIGGSHMQYAYEPLFGLTSNQYRLFIMLLTMPFIISYIFKKKSLFKFLGNLWFYIFIALNIIATRLYIHPT